MAIRLVKIALVFLVGLQGFLYVAGNLSNWSSGHAAISYVLGMQDHAVYSNHIFPGIDNPVLVSIAFAVILLGEFLVGALSFKGVWDLWTVRRSSAETFNAAKKYAVLGPAMAVVVWFGLFIVIGGALFQMWQTEIGGGSFDDAFVFAAMSGLVMLFVSRPDE